jgi:hypothetical protein
MDGVRNEQFVKDEYYRAFIDDMHHKASIYEKEALKLFLDWELHKAHCTMDNARALKTAANIMDNNACNGG